MESFMAEYDNLFSFAFGSLMPIESVAREDGKWAMARDTGATTCGDIMGGLDWCLERATRDISHYYQLSYYVDKTTRPGWHKLRVKSRREGMKVVSWRRGYMLQQSDDEVVRKIEMVGAINSPLDYTGLALTLKFSAERPGAVPFELRISARPDLIDETNNHMSLEVLWLAQDKAGPGDNLKQRATHKPRMTQRLEGKMKPASAEQIRSEGITYRNHLQLASGNYRVHFVVRNNLTGAIGSVWTSVAVP
jgi:hypothetical protein